MISLEKIKEKIKKIPDVSGVYLFKKNKNILYIGKATSLRQRISSYFSKKISETRGVIIAKMLSEFNKIDYLITDSVVEALILENNLIKKHQPKYNTKEKSDKSFYLLGIISGNLPKIVLFREKELKNMVKNFDSSQKLEKIFGPYPNSSALKQVLKIIRPIFPYLDEKSERNYSFYQQIELVPDIYSSFGLKKYFQDIKNIKLFFAGKKSLVLKNLKKEMLILAKNQEFEKANKIKKQIFALNHINDVALIKSDNFSFNSDLNQNHNFRVESYDIAHLSGKEMVGGMVVFSGGEFQNKDYRKFIVKTQKQANDTGALEEILIRRFRHTEWTFPDLIVVDGGVAQLNLANQILKNLSLNIPIVSVVKDDFHKPKEILGDKNFKLKYKKEILLVNNQVHQFVISFHRRRRANDFLK